MYEQQITEFLFLYPYFLSNKCFSLWADHIHIQIYIYKCSYLHFYVYLKGRSRYNASYIFGYTTMLCFHFLRLDNVLLQSVLITRPANYLSISLKTTSLCFLLLTFRNLHEGWTGLTFPQFLVLEEHLDFPSEFEDMPPGWVSGIQRKNWSIWLLELTIHSDLPLNLICLAVKK